MLSPHILLTLEDSASGGLGDMMFPLLIVFAIFYFVLIRPEKKKQRAREDMLKNMEKGDKVMTTSGLLGSVAQIQEDVITLQVADGVRMRFTRAAVQEVLNDKPAETAEAPAKAD